MTSPPPLSNRTKAALAHENSLLAHNPISSDEFYSVPLGQETAKPATLLKVEPSPDTALYSLPPATALSRIMYQSKTFQGDPVPTSAYILWPYDPRVLPDGKYPIVVWAHGTSGRNANAAPSNAKHLAQHWMAPYPLTLQGYVVVAPDYAGLGVGITAEGKVIVHQYSAHAAQANDIVYAVEAARKAFPELAAEFVVMGHSQGGGAAWAVAEREVGEHVDGYLGAVAIAPMTNFSKLEPTNPGVPLMVTYAASAIEDIHPGFRARDLFTERGWEMSQLEYRVLRSGWRDDPHIKMFVDESAVGGKKVAGSMLVIQGAADPVMEADVTTKAVEETAAASDPRVRVQYALLPGLGHVPIMYGSQRLWLEWIDQRFRGGEVGAGLERVGVKEAPRPVEDYQGDVTWCIKTIGEAYEGM